MLRPHAMLSVFLMFATLTAASGARAAQGRKGTAPAGPMLWTAYIENTFRFSQNTTGPITPGLISSFTPFNDVTIVRIEANSRRGPVFRPDQYGAPSETCPVMPSLEVTDGVSMETVAFGQEGELGAPSFTDSGPISMEVPAGERIRLLFRPGSPNTPYIEGYCSMDSINIVVQYRTR